ncbi:MAG: hypothetical protein DDT25_00035 [Chloroflexi bacterium]|nr:hypothetical protein [Chloroflexota bacterium]
MAAANRGLSHPTKPIPGRVMSKKASSAPVDRFNAEPFPVRRNGADKMTVSTIGASTARVTHSPSKKRSMIDGISALLNEKYPKTKANASRRRVAIARPTGNRISSAKFPTCNQAIADSAAPARNRTPRVIASARLLVVIFGDRPKICVGLLGLGF